MRTRNTKNTETFKEIHNQIISTFQKSDNLDNSFETITLLLLQLLNPNGNITTSACNEIMRIAEKERKLNKVCNLKNIKIRPDDGRVYIIINRKTFSSTNYLGLIDKLYTHFFGIDTYTIAEYFELWMDYRINVCVPNKLIASKTTKENRHVWNRWYKDYPIVKIKVVDLTEKDCENHFLKIIAEGNLNKKKFDDIKSILNMLLEHARTENQIIKENVSKNTSSKYYTFAQEADIKEPLTLEERARMIDYLWGTTDIYHLAILFSLYLPIRVGETKGLKWCDIKWNSKTLIIRRFIDDENNVIDGTKSHRGYGRRKVILSDEALEVLKLVKKVTGNYEYIFFQEDGTRPLSTVTYNRRLEKIEADLDIDYRPSHQLRFSVASILYFVGMPVTNLQLILGHNTLAMTLHYLRNVLSDEGARDIMNKALNTRKTA